MQVILGMNVPREETVISIPNLQVDGNRQET